MNKFLRRLPVIVIALAVLAGIAYALWPNAVAVDVARIDYGPLRITVDEDGKTRIKDKYIVSAPLAGRLMRVQLKEGDEVIAGQTLLASIEPANPSLLDPRAQAEARARIQAAQSNLERVKTEVSRSGAALELAQSDFARLQKAADRQAVTQQELDQARTTQEIRSQEERSARYALDVAQFELQQAQAALLHTTEPVNSADWRFEIPAPITGRVLHVFQESAAVVQAGVPLVEVGDPDNLEVVVDVLSRDAVPIHPGTPVSLEHWGGDVPLNGRVRRVEPAAFTKISALGVEEQRVNVLIDFTDPPAAGGRTGLGDNYRVEAKILTWQADHVLKAPTGALFRSADSWAVFVMANQHAERRAVQVGHRGGEEAEILSGLQAGDTVILYPSDRVQDGIRVAVRSEMGSR